MTKNDGFKLRAGGLVLAAVHGLCACGQAEPNASGTSDGVDPIQGEEIARSAHPPEVPPSISRTYATKVLVDIEIREEVAELADGVSYLYWTFGGETPGRFYRVREGDLVIVHLHNHPNNTFAHNIDFQSASGPGGGGDASFVSPGYSATFAWRALRPGLFLYQCSTAPAGIHVANGMYGLILVEPRNGLPKVDHEYQIVQSEFYTQGKFGEQGPQRFSLQKALDEKPEYVVFNGRVGSLTGSRALKAKTGEKIRVYFGNAGPSLASSFHVIGEVFDSVYGEGGTEPNQHDVQVTAVPAGGAAVVDFTAEVAGEYPIIDHSLFRSDNKGAMGLLNVGGRENRMLFSGTTDHSLYDPGTSIPKSPDFGIGEGADGRKIFENVCATCHQATGLGIPSAVPPLRSSDFLVQDRNRAIRIVMSGLRGPVTVNGFTYDSIMPDPRLNDEQIAGVLTYEFTHLGNNGQPVTADEVAKVRKGWDGTSPLILAASAKPNPRRP